MKVPISAAVVAACFCFSSPSTSAIAAPEGEVVEAVSTGTIEAKVTIDPKLKAWRALYANLLAEGRRDLARWRKQSDEDRKALPDIFRAGRRYSFERGYTERSAIGGYVSVLRTDLLDTLGAHPNHGTDTILWDVDAGKRISIRPFFKESATGGPTLRRLAHLIRVALAAEKKKRGIAVGNPDTDAALAAVEPDLLKMGAVALVPSSVAGRSAGLVFYFSPYAVGAYVEGEYAAFIPWTAFKDDLSPAGLALFGGERPAADRPNN